MNRASLLGFALAACVASDALAQTPTPLDPRLLAQIQTLLDEKAARTSAQRKLDSRLVLGMKKQRRDPMFARMPRLRAPLEMSGDRTRVDVRADVTPALEREIRELGGQIVGSYPEWSELQAWVPVNRLERLAARPEVQWIRPPDRAFTQAVTQGDVAHGTRIVREAFPNVDGRGVKVCVLSDGVAALSQLQAAGELPEVEIVGNRNGEQGTEGTAMLEIIHDIAPAASLAFATALGGTAQFAQNILALRASGCLIIVDDVIYASESPFQDGTVAFAVDMVAREALYFASAGNFGRGGDGTIWEADFNGAPAPTPRGELLVNDFGGSFFNALFTDPRIGIRDPPFFTLTWSEPFATAESDYDLFLVDSTRTMVVAASTSFQRENGARFAFEAIDGEGLNLTGGALMVALTSGAPRVIRIGTFDSRTKLTASTPGHVFGHAAALGADAVAAAAAGPDPVNAPFPAGLEFFSSDGPRRIFFTPFGTPLTPGNLLIATGGGVVRLKPDFTAADRVSTASPGFSSFAGTSAAAPHAAAIAALLRSAAPSLPNDKLRFVLKATARDIGAPGFDTRSGAGILDGVTALVLATSGVPCFDGLDNDGDGGVDFPGDAGCASNASVTESPQCSDGVDNDLDGVVDGADAACLSPAGTTECGGGAAQSLAVVPLLAYIARRRRRSSARS